MNNRSSIIFILNTACLMLAVLLVPCSVIADTDTLPAAATEPDTLESTSASGNEDSGTNEKEDKLPVFAELRVIVTQKGKNSTPIKGAKVLITYDDGSEHKGKTDKSGLLVLSDLPYGKVDLDVTSAGMQSEATEILLDKPQVEPPPFKLKPRPIPTSSSD